MIRRAFIPGSRWLYFKIYTGQKSADELLFRNVAHLVDRLYAERTVDNFFYIRYTDPDFHLRLRFHIPDSAAYGKLFGEFIREFEPLADNGTIVKIACDTYVREIERYGADSVELLESLFGIDSLHVLKLLSLVEQQESLEQKEHTRWKLALCLLDDTLSEFGYTLDRKSKLMTGISDRFLREFGFITHAYTKQLNDKYRIFRKEIDLYLSERDISPEFERILTSRRGRISEIAAKLREMEDAALDIPASETLLPSILHMTMNRWFRSQNRVHELVLYDFLKKYYGSVLARRRNAIE